MRAALGASRGALRRTLLAEALVLCGAGAVLGLVLADPLAAVAGRYAARFSVRALESTLDGGVLWLGAGLAVVAAVLLACIPRLPASDRPGGLAPERLNAFVFSALGGIALLISVVGVAGVLAFSVSARTREFGVRLAVGSTPRHLWAGVLWDGVRTAAIGIAVGAAGGYALMRLAQAFFGDLQLPGPTPVLGAAAVLIAAASVASLLPARRASRVDVLQALRSE